MFVCAMSVSCNLRFNVFFSPPLKCFLSFSLIFSHGTCRGMLEQFGQCWQMLEYVGKMLEYVGTCGNTWEYV